MMIEQILDSNNLSGNTIEELNDGTFIPSQILASLSNDVIIGPTFTVNSTSNTTTLVEVDVTTLLFPQNDDTFLRRRRMNPTEGDRYKQVVLYLMIESLTPEGRPGNRFQSREASSSPQLIIRADTATPTSTPTSSTKPSDSSMPTTSHVPTTSPSISISPTVSPTTMSLR